MRKLVNYGLALLFFVSIAYAIPEGNYTQQQLDSINASTINLDCNYNGWNLVYYYNTPHKIGYNFDCLDIKPRMNGTIEMEGEYTVFRSDIDIYFKVRRLVKCMWTYTFSQCRDYMMAPYILGKFQEFKDNIRNTIRLYQTPPDVSGYNFSINMTGVL